jgi:DNA-binding transcriptional LysR family regulator
MFDWSDARYFLAIVRLRSLSAAARHLGVQQSTVGRRLAALEAALDARLFERTPDGYVATTAGDALLPHAERIEDEALAVERKVKGREGQAAGSVRVTAPQAFGFSFLVPLLAQLRHEQPDVVVELVADNLALNLSRREADLALRLGRPQQPQLVTRKLGRVADGLYVARSYLAAHRALGGDDWSSCAYIDFDETYTQAHAAAWLRQRSGGARCALKVNGSPGILTAVRAAMGVGLLPCWLGDSDESLVRIRPGESYVSELWLVMHRDLRHAARIRVVADFFVREIARAAPRLLGQPRLRRSLQAAARARTRGRG